MQYIIYIYIYIYICVYIIYIYIYIYIYIVKSCNTSVTTETKLLLNEVRKKIFFVA